MNSQSRKILTVQFKQDVPDPHAAMLNRVAERPAKRTQVAASLGTRGRRRNGSGWRAETLNELRQRGPLLGFLLGLLAIVALAGEFSGIGAPAATPTQAVLGATDAPDEAGQDWVPQSAVVAIGKATDIGGAAVGPDGQLFLSVSQGQSHAVLLDIDPGRGTVRSHIDVPAESEVHVAAGSVWLPMPRTAPGGSCSVIRYDATTLARQASVPVACGIAGPELVSDGEAVWYQGTDRPVPSPSATSRGRQPAPASTVPYSPGPADTTYFRRIDPDSNTAGVKVPLPDAVSADGVRVDGQGLFFYGSTNSGGSFYRLTLRATAFEQLSPYRQDARPAGQGIWVRTETGQAGFFSSPDAPDFTLPVKGSVIAGSAGAVFTESEGPDGGQIWQYVIDHSPGIHIASAPSVDGNRLSYLQGPLIVISGEGMAVLWLVGAVDGGGSGADSTIYLQWIPLPD